MKYETHFKSHRPDGRHVSTIAAQMAMFRDMKPELALPDDLTPESFAHWQAAVKEKLRQLLCLPEFTPQPEPVKLSSVQRDGYVVEKWEFYPDDYTAVPFLALIPGEASAENPIPGVMCFLGSNHSKEFVAGEPQLDHPNCAVTRYPDRNRMGQYLAQNGMAAFVFDNPGIGETSLMNDPALGELQGYSRVQMCHGYLDAGYNYPGISVFQKLCFMKHLRKLPYIDQTRIGISSHSLGTETAIALGLLCDDIQAIVFNDFLHDDLRRYVSVTEQPDNQMIQDIGNWHIIPGKLRYFGHPDMCAAFAPRYLALTEGGADEFINTVRRSYEFCNVPERLLVSHYPAYADPASRTVHDPIPKYGLTRDDYYTKYSYCIPADHSFRKEPALKLLKQCFGME